MSEEQELSGELKSLEAKLAALAPRADRLDRDKLMFLAGRESALTEARRPNGRLRRWSGSAAVAALSAAAAVAVMVLARPAPQVVERIVEVPVSPQEDSAPAPKHAPPQVPEAKEPAVPAGQPNVERPVGSTGGRGLLASLGLDWLSKDYARPIDSVPSYLDLRRRVLTRGPDLPAPPPLTPGPSPSAGSEPATYQHMRERLMDDFAQATQVPGHDLAITGATS